MQKPAVNIFETGGGVVLTGRQTDGRTDKPLPIADFPLMEKCAAKYSQDLPKTDAYLYYTRYIIYI
jgi:hypothetical protein